MTKKIAVFNSGTSNKLEERVNEFLSKLESNSVDIQYSATGGDAEGGWFEYSVLVVYEA